MGRKFSLIAAAITVLAFTIPTVASATKLTDPVNTLLVASPTKPVTIVGTSTTIELTNLPLGNIACESFKITGTLTENTGIKVVASEDTTGGGAAVVCHGAGGGAVTITNVKLTSFTSETTTNSKGSFSFEVTKAKVTCKFTGTNVPGTFKSGTDEFSVKGPLTTTAACKSGTPEIHGTFTLETPNGIPITIDD